MKSLRDLQRKADARNGDEAALKAMEDAITEAVLAYKRNPSPRLHNVVALRVMGFQKVYRVSEGACSHQ